MGQHITNQTTEPSAAPSAIGVHWIKTTAPKGTWLSVGTSDVSDWVRQDGAGGGGSGGGSGYHLFEDTVGNRMIIPGSNAQVMDTLSAPSPSTAANRQWVLPFYIPAPTTIYTVKLPVGGTLPTTINFGVQKAPDVYDGATPGPAFIGFEGLSAASLITDTTLVTPWVLPEAGLYFLYVHLPAAASGMTWKTVNGIFSTANDPVSEVFKTPEKFGSACVSRTNLITGASTPNPFSDSYVAVANGPRVELGAEVDGTLA